MPNISPFLQRASLCLALATAGAAQADVIRYDFTATVSALTYYAHTTPTGPGPGISLTSSDYAGAGARISIGNLVHGQFFYDTTLGHVINQPPPPSDEFGQYGGAGYSETLAGMRYSVDASGLRFNSGVNTPYITVTDHSLIDGFHMVTITQNSAGLIQEAGITLLDSRHTAFNTTALPGTLTPAQFTSMAIYNSLRYTGRDDALNATMVINTLTPGVSVPDTPPPPVPEPETWGMLLLGLTAVTALVRRKRAHMPS